MIDLCDLVRDILKKSEKLVLENHLSANYVKNLRFTSIDVLLFVVEFYTNFKYKNRNKKNEVSQ